MRATVVYESMYGNTHEVANAIADGLSEQADVTIFAVKEADAARIGAVELLVVGGPTHVHGMASSASRKAAVNEAARKPADIHLEPDVDGPALRDWIDSLTTEQTTAAAAFDTRMDKPKLLTGSASKTIARRLRRRHFDVIGSESFLVGGSGGPVLDGELERARAWGRELATNPRLTTPPSRA